MTQIRHSVSRPWSGTQHSGGIWQTVWLEGRPEGHLGSAHVTPHLERAEDGTWKVGRADFSIAINSRPDMVGRTCHVAISSADGLFDRVERTLTLEERRTDALLEVLVQNPRPWSPEDPHLYHCTITTTTDGVAEPDVIITYFGLRTIWSARWENRPYEYVFLNGEPYLPTWRARSGLPSRRHPHLPLR